MEKLENKIEYTEKPINSYTRNPNVKEISDKVNEIVEWINDHKDQLLN